MSAIKQKEKNIRRFVTLIVVIVMMCFLCACGGSSDNSKKVCGEWVWEDNYFHNTKLAVFLPDGTVKISDWITLPGEKPKTGTWWLDGDILKINFSYGVSSYKVNSAFTSMIGNDNSFYKRDNK